MFVDDLVLVDIETNVDEEQPRPHLEIIQIGAYRLKKLEVVDMFNEHVRPDRHVLTDYSKRLTGITQEEIDRANTFPAVWDKFLSFARGTRNISSWGDYDHVMLMEVCRLNGLAYPFASHLDLKRLFWLYFDEPPQVGGLKMAVGHFGVDYSPKAHNALVDVDMTYKVLLNIYQVGLDDVILGNLQRFKAERVATLLKQKLEEVGGHGKRPNERWTADEVAAQVGMKPKDIVRLVEKGLVKCYRSGKGAYFFDYVDVMELDFAMKNCSSTDVSDRLLNGRVKARKHRADLPAIR